MLLSVAGLMGGGDAGRVTAVLTAGRSLVSELSPEAPFDSDASVFGWVVRFWLGVLNDPPPDGGCTDSDFTFDVAGFGGCSAEGGAVPAADVWID